jgi:beta-lactamase class C
MAEWHPDTSAAIEQLMAAHRLPFLLVARRHLRATGLPGNGRPEHELPESQASGNANPAVLALGGVPPDALFPVASVTKLATALAVLRLVAAGDLGLDDPLSHHLTHAAAAVEGVTLRTLLCHTAGLPDDVAPARAPYARGLTWRQLGDACLATDLHRAPLTHVTYSNVGYGLLALVVEQRTGRPFAASLQELVLEPLAIEGYLGADLPRPPAKVSGKLGEHGGTDLEPFNSFFWRSLAMPWAGLLTTAAGALALVAAFAGLAPKPDFLPAELLATATGDQTGGLRGGFTGWIEWSPCPWGLGPELLGRKTPHMLGPGASPHSFGHSGYSGSLAWCDPHAAGGRGVAFAILGGTRHARGWETFWQPVTALLLAQGF